LLIADRIKMEKSNNEIGKSMLNLGRQDLEKEINQDKSCVKCKPVKSAKTKLEE
jgi:hypothetical protein